MDIKVGEVYTVGGDKVKVTSVSEHCVQIEYVDEVGWGETLRKDEFLYWLGR